MSMTVTRRKDTQTPRVLMHKVADIRGGVSVNVSELGGDYLKEGSVLSAPVNGICHVIKIADVTADVGSTAKTVKVAKGHNFKVGDAVLVALTSVATLITAIDTSNSAYDTITLKATLGAISAGGQLVEAAEESADASALKYTPLAISGTGKPVIANTNLNVDAWLIAVTKGNKLPAFVESALKGIINY